MAAYFDCIYIYIYTYVYVYVYIYILHSTTPSVSEWITAYARLKK